MLSIVSHGRNLVERRLTRSYIRFVCLLVLAVYLIVFIVSFSTAVRGHTVFGTNLGADFGAFYVAGTIFNTHSPAKIYDAGLQEQLYRKQFPDAPTDSHLPYVNAPFLILPFTLLARLPYHWAYLGWVVFSLALYIAGLTLLRSTLESIPAEAWFVAFLLALSFMPFLVECLAGGQTSAIGFFCLAAAISSERRGRSLFSGLLLSLCAYKPTLLLLILPMLVITRRYATLLGFAAGCGVLALVSLLTVGWQGCVGFINTLLYFTDAATSATSGLRTWKYVDVNSFFRLLLGPHSYLRWTMTGAAILFGLALLLRTWWLSQRQDRDQQTLVWAITITTTLVLNLYVGIYDSTLVVLSALLTTDYLYRQTGSKESTLPTSYKFILLLLYVIPWITQHFARLSGVQLFTLVLALFAGYQIIELQRLIRDREQQRMPNRTNRVGIA